MIGAWEESLNQILLKFGVIEKPLQSNAAEELESTLQDYHNLQQYGDMLTKYCYGKKPIWKTECGCAQTAAGVYNLTFVLSLVRKEDGLGRIRGKGGGLIMTKGAFTQEANGKGFGLLFEL